MACAIDGTVRYRTLVVRLRTIQPGNARCLEIIADKPCSTYRKISGLHGGHHMNVLAVRHGGPFANGFSLRA